MQQWEYIIEKECHYTKKDLDKFGILGWELTAVVQKKDFDRYSLDYYFKRQILESNTTTNG